MASIIQPHVKEAGAGPAVLDAFRQLNVPAQ